MSEFYYHGTSRVALASIAAGSLIPSNPISLHAIWPEFEDDLADFEDDDQDIGDFLAEYPEAGEARLYVAHTLALAAEYAQGAGDGAVLRVRRDAVSWDDERSGEIGDAAYTTESIPATGIDVLTADGWLPLPEYARSLEAGAAPALKLSEHSLVEAHRMAVAASAARRNTPSPA